MAEAATEKCPQCGKGPFTKRGLVGHITFGHKGGSVGKSEATKEPAKPEAGAERKPEQQRPAAGSGSDLDKFIFD